MTCTLRKDLNVSYVQDKDIWGFLNDVSEDALNHPTIAYSNKLDSIVQNKGSKAVRGVWSVPDMH